MFESYGPGLLGTHTTLPLWERVELNQNLLFTKSPQVCYVQSSSNPQVPQRPAPTVCLCCCVQGLPQASG